MQSAHDSPFNHRKFVRPAMMGWFTSDSVWLRRGIKVCFIWSKLCFSSLPHHSSSSSSKHIHKIQTRSVRCLLFIIRFCHPNNDACSGTQSLKNENKDLATEYGKKIETRVRKRNLVLHLDVFEIMASWKNQLQ